MDFKKLGAFCAKHGVTQQFIRNVKNSRQFRHPLWERREDQTRHGIFGAFVWQDTPEGHDFWQNINSYYMAEVKD